MATSLRLTIRSTLGEEKSTSDLGFIRSLARAEIGRKTTEQQQQMDYLKLRLVVFFKHNFAIIIQILTINK